MNLRMSTTRRLREVANRIVHHPEQWAQQEFDSDGCGIRDVAGTANQTKCGTKHCIAGWSVALAPKAEVLKLHRPGDGWSHVAAALLGIDMPLAEHLFFGGFHNNVEAMAAFLIALADLPPNKRTLATVEGDERLTALKAAALEGDDE